MAKEFHKFTDAHSGQIMYVDISSIIGIRQNSSPSTNYHNTLSGSSSVNPGYDYVTLLSAGLHIDVSEHITEILAILEGRDPAPAKILFKGK